MAGDAVDIAAVASKIRQGDHARFAVTLLLLLGVAALDLWAAQQAPRRRRRWFGF